MNYTTMNGYEFEDYISAVLRRRGFHVTQTSYSNDGGIDIIAESTEPFLKGKYIVQCKRWQGNVGQPEIRDLYGVVMSERANKGILITTSDFTEQAYSFANGKNIELINGEALSLLCTEDGSVSSDAVDENSTLKGSFNKERYEYLIKRDEDTLKGNGGFGAYGVLMSFLWEYFWNDDFASCKQADIFNKIIEISRKTYRRLKRNKFLVPHQNECRMNLFNAYLVTGNLYEATNMLLDSRTFYLDKWYPRCREDPDHSKDGQITVTDKGERYNPRIQARNLYSAYSQVGYNRGRELMSACESVIISRDRVDSFVGLDDSLKKLLFESATDEKRKVLGGYYDDYFFWSSVYLHKSYGERKVSEYCGSCVDYSKFKSFSQIKANFFPQSNDLEICKQIDRALLQHDVIVTG